MATDLDRPQRLAILIDADNASPRGAACAAYREIEAVELCLRKSPVLAGTGSLGVRLVLEAEDLAALRDHHRIAQ